MWKRLLTRITDSLYIPEDILALRGRLLVHVSDTPSTFYRELRGLIARLEPVALIHTGDMADEVKIGLCPRLLPWYERKLSALVDVLRVLSPERLILVSGNHDDPGALRRSFPDSPFFDGQGEIVVCDLELGLSHDFQGVCVPPKRFNLYGHDDFRFDSGERDVLYLNGIAGVNCIDVLTGDVYSIPYPAYVDRDRSRIRKCGL